MSKQCIVVDDNDEIQQLDLKFVILDDNDDDDDDDDADDDDDDDDGNEY